LGVLAVVSFFSHRFGKHKGCPTKRAPDKWDSARFTSSFLAFSFFYISNIIHTRPLAGNANRSAAIERENSYFIKFYFRRK
jgi:hypothetical protein